jgi:hypothetical protein
LIALFIPHSRDTRVIGGEHINARLNIEPLGLLLFATTAPLINAKDMGKQNLCDKSIAAARRP